MTDKIISIKNLSKIYSSYNNNQLVLKNINFNLVKGDIVSIVGPSGSGKSTFLSILGMLDSDFSGDYNFLNTNVKTLSLNNKNSIRNKFIGFVHQFFHLIPELSVLENVALPNLILKDKYEDSFEIAKNIITNFELQNQMNSKPLNLSGGEQQRVAIARALINNPKLIIADEMTGNLDEKTSNLIFNFFLDKIKKNQQSAIFVTHNKEYALKADHMFEIINQDIIKIR